MKCLLTTNADYWRLPINGQLQRWRSQMSMSIRPSRRRSCPRWSMTIMHQEQRTSGLSKRTNMLSPKSCEFSMLWWSYVSPASTKLHSFPTCCIVIPSQGTRFWALKVYWQRNIFDVQVPTPHTDWCEQDRYDYHCPGIQDINAYHGCPNSHAEDGSSWRCLIFSLCPHT